MPMRIGRAKVSGVAVTLSCFAVLAAPSAARAQAPPVYKVDPFWPKRLLSMQQIVDDVSRFHLDVTRVAHIHGGVSPYSDLVAASGRATTAGVQSVR